MKARWLSILLIWLLLTPSAAADDGTMAEIAQVNTAKYPEVTLYVRVADRAGQTVEGLEKDDFRVTEDGAAVEITAFGAGARSAIATVLTLDRSNSMSVENKLEGAKTAATTFVDLMRAADKVALVAFDNSVITLQPFTSDKEALKKQIGAVSIGNCTAWYDGVYQSVDLIAPLDGRRSVILLSDGIDCRESLASRLLGNGSSRTLDEAIQRASQAGIPIYAIGLGKQATQKVSNEGFDEVKLRRVAIETGGKYYHAPSAADLKQLYRSLSVEMQKEYTLTYRSPRPTYDGTRRNIVVSIQRGAGAGVTTRSGYVEQHLVNFRSDGLLFLALLLPLLVLLLVPAAPRRLAARRRAQPARLAPEISSGPIRADGVGPGALPVAPAPLPVIAAGPAPAPVAVTPSAAALVAPPQQPSGLVVHYPLGSGETTIGRAAGNTIVLTDPSVAPHHARIEAVNGQYVVRDLSNGQTYVSYRGDLTQERPTATNALRDGSSVRFGNVRGAFRLPSGGIVAYLAMSIAPRSDVITIGRDATCDIIIPIRALAPRAAEIRRHEGRWVVENVSAGQNLLLSYSGEPAQERLLIRQNALRAGSTLRIETIVIEMRADV